MNPDDDDLGSDNFLKQQPKTSRPTGNCLSSYEDRRIGFAKKKDFNYACNLQAFAEDELVRKEYKEMRCDMPGMPRSTFLMVFSPDGTKVASTHGNHNIYITDIRSGKNISTLVGHPRTPWCIAFHPTSNQIVASGCLGGQVRIWDLSGGSEVWTTGNQSVIASVAFHPNDRILVIATCNEIYFWDWSKPEPFTHTATSNPKEKVRYVAFDKLGHKLITGIANSPQTRWERVRAPVPVPRQAERSASPYRRRITPRLVTNIPQTSSSQSLTPESSSNREPLSSVPERERRITACYRNLVHEYELLVHRYLQVYRQPAMVDRGTDPMESTSANSGTQTPGPSTRDSPSPEPSTSHQSELPTPSTSQDSLAYSSSSTATPPTSPIIIDPSFNPLRRRVRTLIRGTQTSENPNREQPRNDGDASSSSAPTTSNQPNQRRLLIITSSSGNEVNVGNQSTSTTAQTAEKSAFKMRIWCSPRRRASSASYDELSLNEIRKRFKFSSPNTDHSQPSTSSGVRGSSNRPTFRKFLEELRSMRPKDHAKNRTKNAHPQKKIPRRIPIEISSDSSSSDDEDNRVFTRRPTEPPTSSNTENSGAINYNTELEHLVTNLLTNFEPSGTSTPDRNDGANETSEEQSHSRFSNSLRNAMNNFNTSQNNSATTNAEACPRTIVNTNTRTTNSTIYTNSNHQRRRLGAHRVSAFLPTRVLTRPQLRRHFFSPLRNHINNLESRIAGTFAPDEVINYSERVIEDDPNEQTVTFHPFDPPPEVPTINPENIGIGNMYSNIVQDLESSLTDVQNIRASNRPGETSDMLSSFSERLESIMNQSDSILRNLRESMDILAPSFMRQGEGERDDFYVRENTFRRTNARDSLDNDSADLLTNHNAVTTDHTYPRNPNNTRSESTSSDNMTPLMTSLHVTISHIQRQARLLRRQVESIEHIDRAMLEVAQLQMIRQLYVDMYRHLTSLGESRVSSVRQMMAGTRISDSSPYDSPIEDNMNQNPASSRDNEPGPSSTDLHSNLSSRNRVINRKTYPPSRLLRMQRQCRRTSLTNLLPRRYVPRYDRLARRSSYLKSLPNRNLNRSANDLFAGRPLPGRLHANHSPLNSDALTTMMRRLEHLLMDQTRYVGRQVEPPSLFRRDLGEHIIILRLNGCRLRMNRIMRRTENSNTDRFVRTEHGSVTQDGVSRYGSRHTLSVILDTLSRYFEENGGASISPNLQQQIECVLALSLLLSELLLLQIVDSIPPPTGMNLEPERESLSSRIDQMCTQILQSRLTGQSQQLARSLRLMRMAVRHATQTLRNHHNCRRELLMGSLNRCLRNLRRRRESRPSRQPQSSTSSSDNATPVVEWYRTINELISRYTNEVSRLDEETARSNNSNNNNNNTDDNSNVNAETGEQFHISRQLLNNIFSSSQTNSDEDDSSVGNTNNANNNNNRVSPNREANNRTLYRTNNVNLLNNEEPSTSSQSRPWNVPSVHVNDIPIAESSHLSQPPSYWPPSLRLSDSFSDVRGVHPTMGLFRPRFLHPLYGGVNPFDADRDDPQREQIYDIDMITTITPNHRIQVWDISSGNIPAINNSLKNVVVSECKIHNDASVDIAADGTILVTLLPSGGYLNVTNRLGVYSLRWDTLGQCLYITSFEQNAVSVSLSPLSRHLVVGLASRRVSIMPSDKWTMARIFLLDENEAPYGRLPVLRELEQNRDSRASNSKSVNCIRWLPVSGQGLVYATNTGQLVVLT